MIIAQDLRAAAIAALVRRYNACTASISGMRFKQLGPSTAVAAFFVDGSDRSFCAIIGLKLDSIHHWLFLGGAISPTADGLIDQPWLCTGAWTSGSPGGNRTVSIVGGTVGKAGAVSMEVTDGKGSTLHDHPDQKLALLITQDSFEFASATVSLNDSASSVIWEGPLLRRS